MSQFYKNQEKHQKVKQNSPHHFQSNEAKPQPRVSGGATWPTPINARIVLVTSPATPFWVSVANLVLSYSRIPWQKEFQLQKQEVFACVWVCTHVCVGKLICQGWGGDKVKQILILSNSLNETIHVKHLEQYLEFRLETWVIINHVKKDIFCLLKYKTLSMFPHFMGTQ